MVEAFIGITIISALVFAVHYGHKKGLHLSHYDRALRVISQCEGFVLNPNQVTLIQNSVKPITFMGYALDDANKKLLCFNLGARSICSYDQILEWRVLVNNRTVACLSRLSSADLRVDDPEKDLSIDDFLRKYCQDQRPDPILESVVIKFLLRDLGYPVHAFSLQAVDQGAGDLQQNLKTALAQIDKFKIVMYQGA